MNAKSRKRHKFKDWLERRRRESPLQSERGTNWILYRNASGISRRVESHRTHGISATGLSIFVQAGKRPVKWDLPHDGYDYAACVRAMDLAPDFLEDLAQKALYYLFQWVTSKARAEGFKRGLELGRKLGPKK